MPERTAGGLTFNKFRTRREQDEESDDYKTKSEEAHKNMIDTNTGKLIADAQGKIAQGKKD
jgi:hypothetical protein